MRIIEPMTSLPTLTGQSIEHTPVFCHSEHCTCLEQGGHGGGTALYLRCSAHPLKMQPLPGSQKECQERKVKGA